MTRAVPHLMLADVDADEQARVDFAIALKGLLRGRLRAGLSEAFAQEAGPAYTARHGSAPQSWQQIREAMAQTPGYRWWSATLRAQQEYYVDLTAEIVERQLPELINRAQALTGGRTAGSLVLDPTVGVPTYQALVDIHCVPGSYFLERGPDDVAQGARSDLGAFVFAGGRHGGMNEDKGAAGAAFLKDRFPDLEVRSILDMGCTVGQSTLAWCAAFPDAEVHAIDIAAPCLRYGHARAESLGRAVHFRQANAEATPYADARFDVVVSHILLHETSAAALPRIFAEAHRLLRPGGVMLHIEVPTRRTDPFEQFLANWDCRNNNEPFWEILSGMDVRAPALAAGFPAESIFESVVPTAFAKSGDWLGIGARKAAA
jgi:2-polyprenyl-3-methyl-5-hydroxy-6-metoxy-1,4-benzoquinol methylase